MISTKIYNFIRFLDSWLKSPSKIWTLLGVLGMFFALSAVLNTGYLGDDAYNSQIPGSLMHENLDVFTRTWLEILGWIKGAGRFYPLAFYPYILFYYIRSLLIYKIVSLSVVAISGLAFYHLVNLVFKNKLFSRSLLFLIPLFIQFRIWHDPLLGFHFLVPLVFLWLVISLIFFQKYLDTSKRQYNLLSIFFFIVACATYEISYLFFGVFIALAYFHTSNKKTSIRLAKGHIVVFLFFITIGFILKSKLNPYFTNTYPGAVINFDLHNIKRTLWIQVSAAFPLLYQHITNLSLLPAKPSEVLYVSVVAVLFYRLSRQRVQFSYKNATIFGLLLLVIPAVPLALSAGYQEQLMNLGVGFGYIPVFIQYMGFALVFTASFYWLNDKIVRNYLKVFFGVLSSILLFYIGITHIRQNKTVVQANSTTLYSRLVLTAAIESDLFRNIPPNAIVITNPRFSQDWLWFYSAHARKKIFVYSPEDYFQQQATKEAFKVSDGNDFSIFCGPMKFKEAKKSDLSEKLLKHAGENVYAITYFFDSDSGAYGNVYLAPIQSLVFDPLTKKVVDLKSEKVIRYDYKTGRLTEFSPTHDYRYNFQKIFDEVSNSPNKINGYQEQIEACSPQENYL